MLIPFLDNWLTLLLPFGFMSFFAGEGEGGSTETTKEGESTEDPGEEDIDLDDGEEPIKTETDAQGKKVVPLQALREARAKLKEYRTKNTTMTETMQTLAKAEMDSPGAFRKELERLGWKGSEKQMEKVEAKAEKIQEKIDDLKPGEQPSAALKKEIADLKGQMAQITQGLQFIYRQGIEREYKQTMKELENELASDYSTEEREIIKNEAERLMARREAKSEKDALTKAMKKFDGAYDKRVQRIAAKAEDTARKRSGQPADLGPEAMEFLKADISKIDDRQKKRAAVEDGWAKLKKMG